MLCTRSTGRSFRLAGESCKVSHAARGARSAHRAHPLTSTPTRCGRARRGIRSAPGMHQSVLAVPAALLEREHEVERAHSMLRALERPSGRVLGIEGTAGLGKSRLLEEAGAA